MNATVSTTLTLDELALIIRLLKTELGETRVELRHTQSPEYRELVRHEVGDVRALLVKLENVAPSGQ